jgi:hypothetical protein
MLCFGLGFEMAQGPYLQKSSKAPVPLCEAGEALLAVCNYIHHTYGRFPGRSMRCT